MGETLGSPEPKPAVSASLYSPATPPTESYTQSATQTFGMPFFNESPGQTARARDCTGSSTAHPAEAGGMNPEEGACQNE